MPDNDLPLDYKWINWEHLYTYVGRAVIGDHVPLMTSQVIKYLEDQAKELRRAADRLEAAARGMQEVRRADSLPK